MIQEIARERESKMMLYIEIQLLVKLTIAVKQILVQVKLAVLFFLDHGRRKCKDLEGGLRSD